MNNSKTNPIKESILNDLLNAPEETNITSGEQSIDDLLNDSNNKDLVPVTQNPLPSYGVGEIVDYTQMRNRSIIKSRKLMDSLLKFYLSKELIDNNDYVRARAKLETMTLANLIQQIKYSERAITTLMRSIDEGNMSPRMFEVLGGLQKTMLDIMKHQTLHIMATEENMKKLKRDIDIYNSDNNVIEIKDKSEKRNISSGNRNLMKQIQSEIVDGEFTESEKDEFDFSDE